jgi:SAM-dependent methyltransferase
LRTADELAGDARWTRDLFTRRLEDMPLSMLKDTAYFTKRDRAGLLHCRKCGSIARDVPAVPHEIYPEDEYDSSLLDLLRRRFKQAYWNDLAWYTNLGLQRNATVLEVGSYVGAFLEFAAELGWDALGVDVGGDTARAMRNRGLRVREEPFTPTAFQAEAFDAVFILNCFEQLSDEPRMLLLGLAKLLRKHGRLVIRTPSADFVRLAYAGPMPRLGGRHLLAASNLGGVPYARCYSVRALEGLLNATGFELVRLRGRSPTSLAQAAYGRTPLAGRAVRDATFGLASRLSGTVCFPWFDVDAARAA